MYRSSIVVLSLFVLWLSQPAGAEDTATQAVAPLAWSIPLAPEAFKAAADAPGGSRALDSRVIGIVTQQAGVKIADPISVSRSEESLVFTVRGRVPELQTMRWTMDVSEPVAGAYRYYLIRYKAHGINRDYTNSPVLAVSGKNAAGEAVTQSLINCTQVINDDRWHVMIGKADIGFQVDAVTVQVQTTDSVGVFSIDHVILSGELPETAGLARGLNAGLRTDLPSGSFKPVNLDSRFNDSLAESRERTLAQHGVIVDCYDDSAYVGSLIEGVPLRLSSGGDNLVTTFVDRSVNDGETEFMGRKISRKYFFPVGRDDSVSVEVDGKASEVYLLLAADLPPTTRRYGITETTFHINDIEQVSVEVAYADGGTDLLFPYSLADEGFVIRRALGAYVVPVDAERALKSVTLHNRYYAATVSLAALTLNTSGDRAFPELVAEPEVIHVPDLPEPQPREPYLTYKDSVILAGNGYYELAIDCSDGFAIRKIANRWSAGPGPALDADSGLRVELNGRALSGSDFESTGVSVDGHTATIALKGKTPDNPLVLGITLTIDDSPEARLGMSVANTGNDTILPQLRFPYLGGVRIDNVDATWVCFPKYRNVISNQQGYHFASNDHAFPMQFMDVYNPSLGVGLALITHNLDHMPIDYAMQKNDAGVTAYIQYPSEFYAIPPGGSVDLAETALVSHKGDWRGAVQAYQRWVATWYKPRRSVNDGWFQKVSLLKDYFLTERISQRDLKTPSMYDMDSGKFRAAEFLDMDREYWGGIAPDMFHFFQWYEIDGVDPEKTQYGELGYDNYGGLDRFRAGLQTLQQEYGTPVSLYTLPDRIGSGTEAGKRFGPVAVKERADGSQLVNNLTWYVCSQEPSWMDYFLQTTTKVQAETGADAIYMDVVGFWRTNTCYASDHGHRVPSWCNETTYELVERLRGLLPEHVVIWTEYPVADVSSQFIDGNIAYYYLSLHELFAPAYDTPDRASLYAEPSVNLYRFLFPDVKQIDLPIGNNGSANGPRRLKFIFFHGDGVYDNGWSQFDSRERETLMIKSTAIKNAYRDCFYSRDITPLVPTERGRVYANRFAGKGRTLWTVYNGRNIPVRGRVLAVEHVPGATYYDAWNDKELTPTVENGMAYLDLDLQGQGLGCVVQRTQAAAGPGDRSAASKPAGSDETSTN